MGDGRVARPAIEVPNSPLAPHPSPHIRDLGTLLFSFSSFWAYAWFCQYMLIWYVNNPEETEYFVLRQHDAWQPLFFANLVLNWGVPFVVLLSRRAKETPAILLSMAVIVLLGRCLDLYLMILPAPSVGTSGPLITDAGVFAAALGLAGLVVFRPLPVEAKTAKL